MKMNYSEEFDSERMQSYAPQAEPIEKWKKVWKTSKFGKNKFFLLKVYFLHQTTGYLSRM